jgi:hypothetical protein
VSSRNPVFSKNRVSGTWQSKEKNMKPKIIYLALLLITTFLAIPKASQANHIPNTSLFLEVARNLSDRPDFFEEGRQQFEEEVQKLEKKRSEPVLTIESADLKEGRFTLWMPQETTVEETEKPTINN